MIKISYLKDWGIDGTCYQQRIRASGTDAVELAAILQKDYEEIKSIQKTKRIFSSVEMRRVAYQKPLAETEHEITKNNAIKYFLNLTQLESIFQYVYERDKRILFRNTVLVFDAKGGK